MLHLFKTIYFNASLKFNLKINQNSLSEKFKNVIPIKCQIKTS